jgi:hypothetical protein
MFTTKLSVLAAVVSFGLFAAGCAAEETEQAASTDSDVTTTQTFVDFEPGTFKLYDEPNAEPAEACDIHTVLELTHDGDNNARATLRDVVTGVCYLYVLPNERSFKLSYEMTRCGAEIFSGETSVNGATHHIAITDNRKSLCQDDHKADLIVDEYDQTGVVTTRYTRK